MILIMIRLLKPLLSLLLMLEIFAGAYGKITMPAVFSDNMVLQQKSEVKLWGWAKPGEPIRLTAGWLNENPETKADNQGTWSLQVPTPAAGGPYTVILKGYNELVFENVMIGEVWLCSGQSNMEWSTASGIDNAEEDIAKAAFPDIRFFSVSHSTALYPQSHCSGTWIACTPETMREFSAIAYFFGKRLQEVLDVPIGLINSSWGGTPAEAWMPAEAFEKDASLQTAAARQKPVPWGPVEPARIYNAMVAPLVPYQIAGALWYQGEGNTINASDYKELLTALISGWRDKWSSNFPFYFAQIAPYRYGENFMGVEVRDEQRQALEMENTGMIVLSDIGDTTDIHPRNKKDPALRFANMALNRHYKAIEVEDSGPLFRSVAFKNGQAVVSFNHAEGLHAKGKKVTMFELAGTDGIFHPAEARIENGQVVVKSGKVKAPSYVRFAWSNTATPNLFNGANLPASSFIAGENTQAAKTANP
jgi:sialate O-acetylesterase